MKTSNKLLITFAGIIIALLITTLFILRKDIKSLIETRTVLEYKTVPADKFASLDFSSNWIVSIKQGKDCKVELADEESSSLQPKLSIKNGILYLTTEATHENLNIGSIHARITAPVLHMIKAEGGTEIHMKYFWIDSLTVILKDSSTFSGKNNDFTNITFKTTANDE